MIARDYITAWRDSAPWVSDHQVEQDLVISRALVEVFRVSELGSRLAFRGGTALYKLYPHPAARYSEDFDLVQVAPEPIGETFDAIRAVLDPWLGQPRRVLKEGLVNQVYRFTSEDRPPRPLRLKIEISSREHFAALGHVRLPFAVLSGWWNGEADFTTFVLDELLETKLRALYQCRKGRGLFDIWYALAHGPAFPGKIVDCFERCLTESGLRVTRAAFEENLARKLTDEGLRADMTDLLRPGIPWDADEAAAVIQDRLLARLSSEPKPRDRAWSREVIDTDEIEETGRGSSLWFAAPSRSDRR